MRRRKFIAVGIIGAGAVAGGVVVRRLRTGRRVAPLSAAERSALTGVVDLIAPTDEHGPGAVALGVDAQVLEEAANRAGVRRVLRRGLRWLDGTGTDFLSLPDAARIALLERCDELPARTPQGLFFQAVRRLTFEHYYARPETWEMLGYHGPPQPLGYPDQHLPPESRS